MDQKLIIFFTHWIIQLAVVVRVLLRPHREPASRVAWVAAIALVPVAGMIAYLLFGEVNPGRRRIQKLRKTLAEMPPFPAASTGDEDHARPQIPDAWEHLFEAGKSISGFPAMGGNRVTMPEDSNAVIDQLVADIDAAAADVHLLFYIWLTDDNGCKVAEALRRAARRGVVCRAMVDALGSRQLLRSELWKSMESDGVRLAAALPVANPLLRPLSGRLDLRNHRKLAVIDGHIAYLGSQNCADPEFRIKAKFAPWVDAMLRMEGPVARQSLHVFAGDWTSATGEKLDDLLSQPVSAPHDGCTAQVIATGPTGSPLAVPGMFVALLHSARKNVAITTPYYVPDESIQHALCSCALRGVDTTVIFPARNDSWIVAAASRSYYADMLAAGVRIYEYTGGLLHTKSFTMDGSITLIGSANLDRRSFELNYENNVLICDAGVTAMVRARQDQYLAQSNPVLPEAVRAWPLPRRLWNNTLATLGPLL